MDTIKMVEVTRSDFTESIHYGPCIDIGKFLKKFKNF